MITARKMKSKRPGFFEDYLYWLIGLVCDNDDRSSNYIALFNELQSIEFYWSIELDSNRSSDGMRLRELYSNETGRRLPECDINRPVSLLEVLVAIAMRCEDDIMHESALGDRTPKWFWGMMNNLGFNAENDDNIEPNYVQTKCEQLLSRNYSIHDSGLFYTKDPRCHRNFRKIDLWEQLNHWLNWEYPDD